MEICNLTWKEAQEWANKNPVVIIPVGSTEQHGPHLPLKVDIATADYIARKVCEKTNMLVTPPLNFGYSELWQHYPGTISFSQETFRAALRDICISLLRGGFKKLFILNGHNPNLIHMQALIYELIDEFEEEDVKLGCGTYIFMAQEACDKIGENFRDGTHANEMETSTSLFLFPELVKMDEAEKVSKDYKMTKVISFDKGATFVNRWPDSELHHGAYGNPALASEEKGKAYIEALIDEISQIMIAFDEGIFDPHDENGVPKIF